MSASQQSLLMAGASGSGSDPFIGSVKFLSHFDGTNGSTTFVDETGKTITSSGTVSLSTAQSLDGGSSLSRTTGYIECSSTDFDQSSFTWDGFIYSAGGEWNDFLESGYTSSVSGSAYFLRWFGSELRVWVDGTFPITTGSLNYVSGWNHFEFAVDAGVGRVFLNGMMDTGNPNFSGWPSGTPAHSYFKTRGASFTQQLYIEELRYTAACRHTANFTPPSYPFPDPP